MVSSPLTHSASLPQAQYFYTSPQKHAVRNAPSHIHCLTPNPSTKKAPFMTKLVRLYFLVVKSVSKSELAAASVPPHVHESLARLPHSQGLPVTLAFSVSLREHVHSPAGRWSRKRQHQQHKREGWCEGAYCKNTSRPRLCSPSGRARRCSGGRIACRRSRWLLGRKCSRRRGRSRLLGWRWLGRRTCCWLFKSCEFVLDVLMLVEWKVFKPCRVFAGSCCCCSCCWLLLVVVTRRRTQQQLASLCAPS